MGKDIVSEMVQQMGLTPQMADQLQGGMCYQPEIGQGQGHGLPSTPEEQMRLMEAAQHPPQSISAPQKSQSQSRPVQYEDSESDSDSESTASTESAINLTKIGLKTPPKSMIDNIMDYLKDPLIVMVLFVILSLSQVSDMIKKMLPSVVTSNVYYLLGVKALIMGSAFLGSKLAIN
jgi:hypothetical protein